jgi:hypothetical protein
MILLPFRLQANEERLLYLMRAFIDHGKGRKEFLPENLIPWNYSL